MGKVERKVLPVIVLAQFCCTSLWFAGNAVLPELIANFGLASEDVAHLTSAVQFGFISGTLVYALLAVADRFSPSLVFLVSALLAAATNLGAAWEENTFFSLLVSRSATGFFLAGIYPVGMKIAADYYAGGLGKSLGYLVGALVLGTAFPHLLRADLVVLPWRGVLLATSSLAVCGGVLLFLMVPDGPFRVRGGAPITIGGAVLVNPLRFFRHREFRAAAFGYFGHMWELYAFWAFVPTLLVLNGSFGNSISLLAFATIAIGGIGCVAGGYLSERIGPDRVANYALAGSGVCCLLAPPFVLWAPGWLMLTFLLVWGTLVVADSPMFSTLVARSAPAEGRGSALTIVNCLGFALTILSIQTLGFLLGEYASEWVFVVLVFGPAAGLICGRNGSWRLSETAS